MVQAFRDDKKNYWNGYKKLKKILVE